MAFIMPYRPVIITIYAISKSGYLMKGTWQPLIELKIIALIKYLSP